MGKKKKNRDDWSSGSPSRTCHAVLTLGRQEAVTSTTGCQMTTFIRASTLLAIKAQMQKAYGQISHRETGHHAPEKNRVKTEEHEAI